MRVRAGVDHDAVDLAAQAVNLVDDLPFAVVLREAELRADLAADRAQRSLDVRKRLAPVQCGLARAEEIQIRAVDDGDLHVFLRPLSQLLNCAMSSATLRRRPRLCPARTAARAPPFAEPSASSSAKN